MNEFKSGQRVWYFYKGKLFNSFINKLYNDRCALLRDSMLVPILELFPSKEDAIKSSKKMEFEHE